MSKPNQQGFTLIEILIYTVIFAIVGGMLTGILINATKVEQRESASAEVTSQLNFVMQTIGRLVRESSNIEIEAGTATSTLKLRMRDSTKDPTYITLSNDAIKLQEGSSATTTLTSDRVVVNTLSFKKFTQYPGHDTVSIDLTMTYNTQNTAGQVQRTLSSAIARVSAATFDSDVLPGGTYNYNLGQTGSPWQKIIMADGSAANPSYTFGSDTGLGIFRAGSNALGFTSGGTERMRISGAAVGIGTTTPDNALSIEGNGRISINHANEPLILMKVAGVTTGMIGIGPGTFTGAGANDLGIRSDNGGGIALGVGNTRYITMSSAGNVGIGTSTPPGKLYVAGDIRAQGTDYISYLAGSGVNEDTIIRPGKIGGVIALTSGNVGIGTTNPGKLLTLEGSTPVLRITNTVGPKTFSLKVNGNNLEIADGLDEAARVTIDTSGNVGIGTSTPTAKLHIAGAGSSTNGIKLERSAGAGVLYGSANCATDGATLVATNGVMQLCWIQTN